MFLAPTIAPPIAPTNYPDRIQNMSSGNSVVNNSGNTTNTVNNSQGLVLGNKTTTSDKDDPFSLANQIKAVGGSAAFGF